MKEVPGWACCLNPLHIPMPHPKQKPSLLRSKLERRHGFLLCACAVTMSLSAQEPLPSNASAPSTLAGFSGGNDVVINDFEQAGYGGGWEVEGAAFGKGPVKGKLPGCAAVSGMLGKGFVDSRLDGDKSQGILTSPEITITRKYIRFLIAGADYAGEICVNLVHDGKVVRTSTGSTRMFYFFQPVEWDVSEFVGKKARIQIVDHSSKWMGHILVDHIIQSDRPFIQTHAIREFSGGGKYLLLPISNEGRYWTNVTVFAGDEVLKKFPLVLAAAKPDWWGFIRVPDHDGGVPLRVEVDKLPRGSKGLERIALSDEATGYTPYDSKMRPQFHYTPRCGYMGDANGLVYEGGVWHLFYQHNPFSWSATFSVLNWGHATSRDLIHWEEHPDALPSPLNERRFLSGSAVIDKDNTGGFGPNAMVAFSSSGGESLFHSADGGRTFQGWERNPVVSHAGRDPRVFWYDPGKHWVMVVYDETDGSQRNAIYTSSNLKDWTFQSAVDGFFECPDLFELPVDGEPNETAWLMFGVDNQYLIGKFDGKTFTPEPGSSKSKGSHGWYLYAAQTFNNAPDGRRIQMGCLKADYRNASFNHVMSVPLELTLHRTSDGLKLRSVPVRELEQLREDRKEFADITLANNKITLPGIDADLKDMTVEFTIPCDVSRVGIKIGGTEVNYDVKANQLGCRDVKAPLEPVDGKVRLRILSDRGVLEIFANDGFVYMPVSVPVASDAPDGLSLFAKGKGVAKARLEVYGMRPAWGLDEESRSFILGDFPGTVKQSGRQ